MFPNRLYWACQFLGWSAVATFWLNSSLQQLPWPYAVLDAFGSAAFMLGVTDAYRRLAHKWGWLRLPDFALLSRMALGFLLVVALYMLQAFVTYQLKVGGDYFSNNTALNALAGGSRYVAIWLLAFHLYHYARKSAEQQAAVTEAHLAKLSNELNPHFLFNALNSVKGLTREDPAGARAAIDHLAGILRYSLNRTNEPLVNLTDELAIIHEYLELEKIRFEERLTVEWDLPEGTDGLQLPPLSLHTLIENGVKHGLSKFPAGGILSVAISRRPTAWEYTVRNPLYSPTSPGTRGSASVLPEKMPDEGRTLAYSTGTGLVNLRQRLSLQYDQAASLIITESAGYFTATMTLPV